MKDTRTPTEARRRELAQAQREVEEMTHRVIGLKVKTDMQAGGAQPPYGTPP